MILLFVGIFGSFFGSLYFAVTLAQNLLQNPMWWSGDIPFVGLLLSLIIWGLMIFASIYVYSIVNNFVKRWLIKDLKLTKDNKFNDDWQTQELMKQSVIYRHLYEPVEQKKEN